MTLTEELEDIQYLVGLAKKYVLDETPELAMECLDEASYSFNQAFEELDDLVR